MDESRTRQQLVRILQNAYSGELAAGYAYRGHWKSVKDPGEKGRIQQIECEEWIHRERVGGMLVSLDSRPPKTKEVKMWIIGRVIAVLCHVTGWFLPMYFAGRLESGNVEEYEEAARHAHELGLTDLVAELHTMAAVENEHEVFFSSMVANHRLLPLMRVIFSWGPAQNEARSKKAA